MTSDLTIRLLAGAGLVAYALAYVVYRRQPATARAHSAIPVLVTVPALMVLALYLLAALVARYVNLLR